MFTKNNCREYAYLYITFKYDSPDKMLQNFVRYL